MKFSVENLEAIAGQVDLVRQDLIFLRFGVREHWRL